MIRSMREQLIKALVAHAHGDIQKHVANVEVYLNNPAGIGEHSKLLEEINSWTHKLAEAEENIEVLKKYFEDDGYAREDKGLLNG